MTNSQLPMAVTRAAARFRLLGIGDWRFVEGVGCQTWTRTKTSGLTGRRATLTLSGNGAAGRIPTCILLFRRRMPDVFDHGSILKWSERQDFHLRPRGPKPSALKTELRGQNGIRDRTCTD